MVRAGNLALNETVAGLKAKGVAFDTGEAESTRVLLIPAEQQTGPAYRVGFKNFEVITRYNRSVRYAMAVHDLATTLPRARRDGDRDHHAETKLAAQSPDSAAAVR